MKKKIRKKKIALLVSSWDGELLESVIEGIKGRLNKTGYDVHAFVCFPSMGIKDPDNFGNYNIFSLANYAEYDGFLISVNVINGVEMLREYHSKILESGKPIVMLDQELEGMSSVTPDGYIVMTQLMDHLIEDHNCRDLIYVGGSYNHPDNVIRKKAFVDALERHGIEVDNKKIRDYWFMDSSGRQAYRDFKEIGCHLPDAVVCANDATALGYCQEAELDGYYPPKDFLITGFDNDDNSRSFFPMITSVEKDAYKLGYEGCDMLLRKMEKKEDVKKNAMYAPKLVRRGSCGCYSKEENVDLEVHQIHQMMYSMKKEITAYYEDLTSIRQGLALASTEGLFRYYLYDILKRFQLGGYAMCLNSDLYFETKTNIPINWDGGYCKEIRVLTGMRAEKRMDDDAYTISVNQLYPDYLNFDDEETHVYMFLPIQKMGINYGYLVVADGGELLKKRFCIQFIAAINNAYANLRNVVVLERLNNWLDNVYTEDAMTGLYNRFGYMRQGYEMFERSKAAGQPLIVMFMDMDRLKYINDTFGHSSGDEALIAFSTLLKKCAGEDKLAIRYGGDEFLIIGPVDGEAGAIAYKDYVLEQTRLTNEERDTPYEISSSIGYILTDPKSSIELDTYVKQADKIMYEEKKKRKKNRVE